MGKVTKTFVDGQPLTAADLNSIKNGVNALYSDERNEVTDTNYIEAFDANGNPVKISKASLASVIADVIKATPAQQAKVTFGAPDAAGLASVVAQNMTELPKTLVNKSYNADSPSNDAKIIYTAGADTPSGFMGHNNTILQLANGLRRDMVQIGFCANANRFAFRTRKDGSEQYTDWQDFNFGCSTTADLASVVAGVYPNKAFSGSSDDINKTGVYTAYSNMTDVPSSLGILLCFMNEVAPTQGTGYTGLQLFFQRASCHVWYRTKHYSAGWEETWLKIV